MDASSVVIHQQFLHMSKKILVLETDDLYWKDFRQLSWEEFDSNSVFVFWHGSGKTVVGLNVIDFS